MFATVMSAQLPQHQRHPAAHQAPPPRRVRVLYVEDNPVNAMVMAEVLRLHPAFDVEVAETAAAGWRQATQCPPDLLLLDYTLPDGNGLQLLDQLRTRPGLSQVPAILVTADDQVSITDTSVQERWLKPIDAGHVLHRLQTMFSLEASRLG